MTVTATDARRDFSAEPNTVSTSDPDTTLDDEQEKKERERSVVDLALRWEDGRERGGGGSLFRS